MDLSSLAPPKLDGSTPTLSLGLANPGEATVRPFIFSRTEQVAGLDARVLVTPPNPAGSPDALPGFAVALTDKTEGEGVEAIAHDGQPLAAMLVDGARIRTQDGSGRIQEQAAGPLACSRSVGQAASVARLSRSEGVVAGAMQLELSGVDVDRGGPASGSPLQSWTLHDGQGSPARLAGFPLRPLAVSLRMEGATLVAVLEAVVGLLDLDPADAAHDGRDLVPTPGAATVTLEFRRPFELPGPWSIKALGGGIDWQFRLPPEPFDRPCLTRLAAEVVPGTVDPSELKLTLRRVDVMLPVGPVSLGPYALAASAKDGKLPIAIPAAAPPIAVGGLAATLVSFTLDKAALEAAQALARKSGHRPDPHPTAPTLSGSSFAWSKSAGSEAGSKPADLSVWSLTLTDDGVKAASWGFLVRRGEVDLVKSPLIAVPAAEGRWLLHTSKTVAGASGKFLATGQKCWFDRSADDLAVVAATFAAPTKLAALTAEVLVHLALRPGTDRDGAATADSGEILAQVSLAATAAGRATESVSATGSLTLVDQINYRLPDKSAARHEAMLTFDRLVLAIEAVFLGKGPTAPQVIATVVEHRVVLGATEARWQAAQPVRLRQAGEFERSVLGVRAGADPDRLAIDAGWAFWVGDRPLRDVDLISDPVLESPHLDSLWRLRGQPPLRGEFDRQSSYVVRLPFGHAHARPLAAKAITLTNPGPKSESPGSRPVLGSGAQAGPTTAVPGGDPPAADPGATEFVYRGPNAHWLDPAFLAREFPVPPGGELLLAFGDAPDAPVSNQLPAELGDFAWLQAVGSASGLRPAAALRTPYVPRGGPIAMHLATLAEFPFLLRAGKRDASQSVRVAGLQVLGFRGTLLRRLARTEEGADSPGQAGREALRLLRRDDAGLVLKDLEEVTEAFRPIAAQRSDRPTWPDLSPDRPAGGAAGRNAAIDPDAQRRDAIGLGPTTDSAALPGSTHPRPTVLAVPVSDDPMPVPDWVVFAARPEITPEELNTKGAAATRFRLALVGKAPTGRLAEARVARAVLDAGLEKVKTGSRLVLTKREDVAFEVCDTSGFPEAGAGPLARRSPITRDWPKPEADGAGPPEAISVAPPLVDVVAWARRPGEAARTLLFGQRLDFADEATPQPDRYAPGRSQELTLRRPRATAGPFEAVRIEVRYVAPLLDGSFQYAKLALRQRVAATDPPQSGTLQCVVVGAAEVFPGDPDISAASTRPALLREHPAKDEAGNPTKVMDPFGLHLVADKDFSPRADFDGGKPAIRTVSFVQVDQDYAPSANPTDPPVLPKAGRVILFEDLPALPLPGPTPAPPPGTPPPPSPFWSNLAGDVLACDVIGQLDAVRPESAKDLRNLLVANKTVYWLTVRYSRPKGDAPWSKPGGPLAVSAISALDSSKELVKPRSGVSILHKPLKKADELFRLAGYGRLDDDDFSPISPDAGPEGRVAWSRVALLQTLDRLSEGTQLDKPNEKGEFQSALDYDVVFYGPGGELVPTEAITP